MPNSSASSKKFGCVPNFIECGQIFLTVLKYANEWMMYHCKPCPRKSQVLLPPWKKPGRFYRVPFKSLLRVQIKRATIFKHRTKIFNSKLWRICFKKYYVKIFCRQKSLAHWNTGKWKINNQKILGK